MWDTDVNTITARGSPIYGVVLLTLAAVIFMVYRAIEAKRDPLAWSFAIMAIPCFGMSGLAYWLDVKTVNEWCRGWGIVVVLVWVVFVHLLFTVLEIRRFRRLAGERRRHEDGRSRGS